MKRQNVLERQVPRKMVTYISPANNEALKMTHIYKLLFKRILNAVIMYNLLRVTNKIINEIN